MNHHGWEHVIHMIICCIIGVGIGTALVYGYNKIRENKDHNP